MHNAPLYMQNASDSDSYWEVGSASTLRRQGPSAHPRISQNEVLTPGINMWYIPDGFLSMAGALRPKSMWREPPGGRACVRKPPPKRQHRWRSDAVSRQPAISRDLPPKLPRRFSALGAAGFAAAPFLGTPAPMAIGRRIPPAACRLASARGAEAMLAFWAWSPEHGVDKVNASA